MATILSFAHYEHELDPIRDSSQLLRNAIEAHPSVLTHADDATKAVHLLLRFMNTPCLECDGNGARFDIEAEDCRISCGACEETGRRTRGPKDPHSDDCRISLPQDSLCGFWRDCTLEGLCERPPYDRLLTNDILAAQYGYADRRLGRHRHMFVHRRCHILEPYIDAILVWAEGRASIPRDGDGYIILPDQGQVAYFSAPYRRCGRPPYDRLLTNPILRTQYETYWAEMDAKMRRKFSYVV